MTFTVSFGGENIPSSRLWEPVAAEETQRLVLPTPGRSRIIAEASEVLGKCFPPSHGPGSRTGLVTGYVQSGKTLSFTTVAALARDNGFRVVIVIAGTTRNLHAQSLGRLREDLALASRGPSAPWLHVDSPKPAQNFHVAIDDCLAEWDDPAVPSHERKTVLITVLKGHSRLASLASVLGKSTRIHRAPVVVIDDEGDQAGLNAEVNFGDQSRTYERILELKAKLPCHSYLLYTATPQAPLLINIADILAPDFCVVLTPGEGYTGGSVFFSKDSKLICPIPPTDISTRQAQLVQPPESLLEALRLYFLGVAAGIVKSEMSGNRAMLVHPSSLTAGHAQYGTWVSSVRTGWLRTLEAPESDPDRRELLDIFLTSFAELVKSGFSGLSFADIQPRLVHALRRTVVKIVNSEHDTNIDWSQSYSWILVGGQAMDRGFTVNGLTVTYMPRLLGVGNADTVQQRARFFGYKSSYLPLCRVFLEQQVSDAFRSYIEHEEDVRQQLKLIQAENRSLKDWKRRFVLSGGLRPTRDSVVDVAYRFVRLGDDWTTCFLAHPLPQTQRNNREVVAAFTSGVTWSEWTANDERGSNSVRNAHALLRRDDVLEKLLLPVQLSRVSDSRELSAVLRVFERHKEALNREGVLVVNMSSGQGRERRIENGDVDQLFQGEQFASGRKVYPGDRQVRSTSTITVQIHQVIPKSDGDPAPAIPCLAVFVPEAFGMDIVEQPQGVR